MQRREILPSKNKVCWNLCKRGTTFIDPSPLIPHYTCCCYLWFHIHNIFWICFYFSCNTISGHDHIYHVMTFLDMTVFIMWRHFYTWTWLQCLACTDISKHVHTYCIMICWYLSFLYLIKSFPVHIANELDWIIQLKVF